MRTPVGMIAGVALAASTMAGATVKQASEAALIANERALYDAVARHDHDRFRALTLPAGFWATPSGFVPMDRLASGLAPFDLPQAAIENPHVVWKEGNSALVLSIRTGGGRFGDRPLAAMALASTLWTKPGWRYITRRAKTFRNQLMRRRRPASKSTPPSKLSARLGASWRATRCLESPGRS